MFCWHFLLTRSWAFTGTRFKTGTTRKSDNAKYLQDLSKLLTVQVEVIAAVEETQAVGTGAATHSICQNAGEGPVVGSGDRASGRLLVAAGDDGVVATLGVGLVEGNVLGKGVLNTVTLAGSTVTGGRESQSSGSEEESRGEELHFDGLGVDKNKR